MRQTATLLLTVLLMVSITRDASAQDATQSCPAGSGEYLHGRVLGGPFASDLPWVGWVDEAHVHTDTHGCFVLPRPESSPPWILVYGRGASSTFAQVEDDTDTLALSLSPLHEESLLRTRTEQRTEVERPTAGTTVLDRARLASAPARNAEELLRHAPGLTLVQHGSEGKGHQFFLRGFDAAHGADVAVTLHGIPLNEASHIHGQGYVDLGLIPHLHVEEVVLRRGPFALDQGPFAMAGSVDFQLVGPHHPTGRGLATHLLLGTPGRVGAGVSWSPPDAHGRRLVGLESVIDRGFGPNRALRRGSALGLWQLGTWGAFGEALVLGAAHATAFEVPGTVRQDDLDAGRMGFTESYQSGNGGSAARALLALLLAGGSDAARWNLRLWTGGRTLDLMENYTGWLLDPVIGDRRQQTHRALQGGLESDLRLRLAPDLHLLLGGGGLVETLAQTERPVDPEGAPQPRVRDLDGTQVLAHVRGGLAWTPWSPLTLRAGARLDAFAARGSDRLSVTDSGSAHPALAIVSPRTSLQWRATDTFELLAAWGHGVRPPELRALASGDPERTGFDAERVRGRAPAWTRSRAVELGVRWRPTERLEAQATGFRTLIDRESVLDHVSGQSLALNATERRGAEVELTVHPLPGWQVSADATLVDARFRRSGNPVPFAPRQVLGLRTHAAFADGWRAGARALHIGPRPLPHGARGTTLHQVDATLGYTRGRWQLDLDLENLLGLDLREGEYHYASYWRPNEPASALPVLHTSAGPPRNVRLRLAAHF